MCAPRQRVGGCERLRPKDLRVVKCSRGNAPVCGRSRLGVSRRAIASRLPRVPRAAVAGLGSPMLRLLCKFALETVHLVFSLLPAKALCAARARRTSSLSVRRPPALPLWGARRPAYRTL